MGTYGQALLISVAKYLSYDNESIGACHNLRDNVRLCLMNDDIPISRNGEITPKEIEDLRSSVGWDRAEGIYEEVLQRHFAYYTSRSETGKLIGYLSVLSDGIADAFLIDLAVDPECRHTRLGTRLVKRAIRDAKDAGIRCVQVTFEDHLDQFYAQCGFHIFKGGIIDFENMTWAGDDE